MQFSRHAGNCVTDVLLQPFLPSCPTAQALAEKKKRNRTFIDPVSEVQHLYKGSPSPPDHYRQLFHSASIFSLVPLLPVSSVHNSWLQVPQLEEWFEKNSHPCHAVVASYTDSLNRQPYRYFPLPCRLILSVTERYKSHFWHSLTILSVTDWVER